MTFKPVEPVCQEYGNGFDDGTLQRCARRHTITADQLLALGWELSESVTWTVDERGNDRLTDHSRGLVSAVERLHQLLDELANHDRR